MLINRYLSDYFQYQTTSIRLESLDVSIYSQLTARPLRYVIYSLLLSSLNKQLCACLRACVCVYVCVCLCVCVTSIGPKLLGQLTLECLLSFSKHELGNR
jgi:hypothetical protein